MTVYNAYWQCTTKQPYLNRREALTAQKRRDRRPGSLPGSSRVRPYACPHCGRWHLGHDVQKARQR